MNERRGAKCRLPAGVLMFWFVLSGSDLGPWAVQVHAAGGQQGARGHPGHPGRGAEDRPEQRHQAEQRQPLHHHHAPEHRQQVGEGGLASHLLFVAAFMTDLILPQVLSRCLVSLKIWLDSYLSRSFSGCFFGVYFQFNSLIHVLKLITSEEKFSYRENKDGVEFFFLLCRCV